MGGRGKFITLEGGEGCGKSTIMERLAERLRAAGRAVLTCREPGGTEIGEQIRQVLQYTRYRSVMCGETELLLFAASRAQLVREVIEPSLAAGRVVLCDRFMDSTTVYQGAGRGLDAGVVAAINRAAVGSCMPDLTVVIDLDPRIGLERARGRDLFDRMENQALEFYERVRAGYLALAQREPARVKVVDGAKDLAAVEEEVWRLVQDVVS
ncbi:MAG: dTMP kinase [Verrucomicrobiae bacterium]|nr:dTMP kinase [Verrucomicrobiae bacterium]MDW8344481.1 dTMP kinase [Verrucomicrobiae bacterium]